MLNQDSLFSRLWFKCYLFGENFSDDPNSVAGLFYNLVSQFNDFGVLLLNLVFTSSDCKVIGDMNCVYLVHSRRYSI